MSNKIHNNQLLYPLSGSFSGSFVGDGGGLTNLPFTTPNFQQVTDEGDTTTSNINIGELYSTGIHSTGDVEVGQNGAGAGLYISSTGTGERGAIRADTITADTELQIPDNNGTIVIAVNNISADSYGNVDLTIPNVDTGSLATTGSNTFVGNQIITGSVTASLGFYGNLNGTASYATNALSASFAISSSQATSASYAYNSTSASYALSASWAPGGLSGGTNDYIPRWSSDSTLTSSVIFQSGSRIGVNILTPSASYHIKGATTSSISSSLLITNFTNSSSFEVKDNGDLFSYGSFSLGVGGSPTYKLQTTGSGISGSLNINNQLIVNASGSVGIGILTPASSAVLDVTSLSKGVLVPRMTTTQRNAISSPATGLMIYNTTTLTNDVYNGTNWKSVLIPNSNGDIDMGGSNGTYFSISNGTVKLSNDGNARYLEGWGGMNIRDKLNPTTNYIGTTSTYSIISSNGNVVLSPNSVWSRGAVTFTSTISAPSSTTMTFNDLRYDGVKSAIIRTNDFTSSGSTPINLILYAGSELGTPTQGNIILAHDGTNQRGNVIVGSSTATTNAIFKITSTTKGFMPPTMTTTQRDAVTWVTGDAGMIIYNTTNNKHQGWDGSAWNDLY